MDSLRDKIERVLGSRRFYIAALVFFVLEALWVALSAKYPMAFDEEFHLGVIRVYSGQPHPFLPAQPDGANAFGALAADPSYLYHYLMSFPYRLISFVTDNQEAQVIFLRIINIAIITSAVALFRQVLLRAGASRLLSNVSVLLFALVPTVPLLAGQINYDSLLMLALAWVCWLALRVTQDFQAHRISIRSLCLLAVSLMLACLVKYAFLPLAFAAGLYIVVLAVVKFRGRSLWSKAKKDYLGLAVKVRWGLLVLLIAVAGLFAQRYAVNIAKYGNPVPPCDAVISLESCMEYGPWARNYRMAASKPSVDPSRLSYTWQWLQGMHYRLFFTITGPPTYTNYPPSPLPSAAALVVLLFGAASLVFYWRKIFRGHPFLLFLLLMVVIYALVLWQQNYSQFIETGQPVAINGRYFIPLLFPGVLLVGRGLGAAIGRYKGLKAAVAILVVVCFCQGGGVFGFILRSDESWYWSNRAVVRVNETAKRILEPIIFEGPKHY